MCDGKRVQEELASSRVDCIWQSTYAEVPAKLLKQFCERIRRYLVYAYPFLCVTRETSRIETRKFACRLHIAIDIRRGSRKIAETILRKDTALSRFIYYVVASSRDRAIFDCEGICRGTRKNITPLGISLAPLAQISIYSISPHPPPTRRRSPFPTKIFSKSGEGR